MNARKARVARRQVAVRVTEETLEALQIAVALSDHMTLQDLVGPVIETYAAELATEVEISKAIELKHQRLARMAGKLAHLPVGRREQP